MVDGEISANSNVPTGSEANGHSTNGDETAQTNSGAVKPFDRDLVRQLCVGVLKLYRNNADGDSLFQKLRGPSSQEAFAELGVKPCGEAEIEKAYSKCVDGWKALAKNDVQFLVQRVLQECDSLMQVDDKFRSLQKKIGRKMENRGVMTAEALKEARERCQAYWARITPGNVSLIQNNIAGRCTTAEDASKKFDWLWKNGTWSEDRKSVTVKGRDFTIEDLEQGERNCQKRFGITGPMKKRTPPNRPVQEVPKPEVVAQNDIVATKPVQVVQTSEAEVKKETGSPTHDKDGIKKESGSPMQSKDDGVEKESVSPTKSREPMAVDEPPSVPMDTQEDASAVADVAAQVAALALAGTVTDQDVKDEMEVEKTGVAAPVPLAEVVAAVPPAEKPVAEVKTEEAPSLATPTVAVQPADEEPTSPVKKKKNTIQESNADFIMGHILKKCSDMQSAQKFFKWLREHPGSKIRGRLFSASDVEEAEGRCRQVWQVDTKEEIEVKEEQKVKIDDNANLTNVEVIVQQVMKKATDMSKAEKYFDMLNRTVGQKNALGRIFTEEEVTMAYLECQDKFAEQDVATTTSKKKSSKVEQVSGCDAIVRYVLRKCDSMDRAEKEFSYLHDTMGQPTVLGRVFTEIDVTEAYFKCQEFFEQYKEESESDSDSDDSSGDSESSEMLSKRGRPKKGTAKDPSKQKVKKEKKDKKKKKKRKAGIIDEEMEGALFGSDSDDSLSGEESLDEEDESAGAALLADLGLQEGDEPTILDDGYPVEAWDGEDKNVLPGYEGFNRRATQVMQSQKVGAQRLQVQLDVEAACPPLQPHQEATGFMLHPKSPVTRMLVDHPTGSGKTREMIKVLDNYFYDPRAKVPVFPKDPVCRNFYVELLRWPSRYRDYFCCEKPADAAIASGRPNWKETRFHMWNLSNFREEELRRLCYVAREVLEMKGMFFRGVVRRSCRLAFHKANPGEGMPMAPLRALGYTSAGGSFSQIIEDRPQSSLMKIGYEKGTGNVYSNKVVLMDEAHNLVRTQTQYAEQLHRLRDLLFTAKNLVLVGFTGTPILNEPTEGRQLLDIIKGCDAPEGDEGFLSSFPMRPQPLFPLSLPRGVPDGVLTLQRRKQLVSKVEIHGETLKTYDWKRRLGIPARRLRAYCNMATYHGSFHEGKNGTKVKVLMFPEENAPKLYAIAMAIVASPLKAVIMTSRMSGYVVMLELMRFIANKQEEPFGVATMDELSEFNHISNLRGEKFRVMVADAATCSEGVSFLAVRRTYIADVPVSPSQFIQQCGRCIRMYGHRSLRDDEQTVTNHLFVSVFPKWMRSSIACWALRAQKKMVSGKEFEKKSRLLTARLYRAGFKTLGALKEKIDAHGVEKMRCQGRDTGEKAILTSEDVVGFLEQNGLWEEARLLRVADKKEQERAQAMSDAQGNLTKAIEESKSDLLRADTADTLESMNSGTLEQVSTMMSMGSIDAMEMGEIGDDFSKALEEAIEDAGLGGELDAAFAENQSPGKQSAGKQSPGKQSPAAAASSEAVATQAVEAASSAVSSPSTAAQTSAVATAEASPVESVPAVEGSPDASPMEVEASNDPAEVHMAEASPVESGPALEGSPEASPVESEVAAEGSPEASPHSDLAPDEGLSKKQDAQETAVLQEAPAASDATAGEAAANDAPAGEGLTAAPNAENATEGGGVGDSSAVPATAPVEPVPVDPEVEAANAAEQRKVVAKVLVVLREVCEEITKAAKARAAPPTVTFDPVTGVATPAVAPIPLPGAANPDTVWKGKLEDGLKEFKDSKVMVDACHVAVHSEFDASKANLRTLTAVQVRALRSELIRLEKFSVIAQACAVVTIATREIENPTSEEPEGWRIKLEEGLREFRLNDDFRNALKAAAPNLVGEGGNADLWNTCSLTALSVEQVKLLQEELAKTKSVKEKPGTKPRALVRAMQALYQAESLEEAELSLLPETADEEALRQLTERSQEFAPALSAMRKVAVDHEVFAHLADQSDAEGDEADHPESEASDVEKDLIGKKEMAPVVLPAGWRLEWVKRKKREAREFVDPVGNRYTSVREVRQALNDWEKRGQADAEEEEDGEGETMESYAALSTATAFGWGDGDDAGAKRRRLRGKTSGNSTGSTAPAIDFGAMADDMFGDMLDATLEAAPQAADQTNSNASSSSAAARPAAKPGLRVVLHSLQAKPELNGKFARLRTFLEDSGRWELIFEPGASCEKANVKPSNFTVLPAVQQAPAPQYRPNKRIIGKTSIAAMKRPVPASAGAAASAPSKARRRGANAAEVPAETTVANDDGGDSD